MAEGDFELTTTTFQGLEKSLDWAFVLGAGDKLKAEVGENELDETVPEGKIWHGKFQIFIREDDI